MSGSVNRRHGNKERKNSQEGSLDRVLFSTELEFPKATSEYIICKQWIPQEIKATMLFIRSTDMSSIYCADISLSFTVYAWCNVYNIWLLFFEN